MRFNSKDIDAIFPTASGSVTMLDNTICKVFDGKNWADRTPNNSKYKITYDNNVFYDCMKLEKLFQNNCSFTYHQELNTWGGTKTISGTDKAKWVTEDDPGFSPETFKELDFTQPNFGLNFKATGAISSTIGDPRWRK